MEIYSIKPPIAKSLVKMVDEYNFVCYSEKVDLTKYRDIVLKVILDKEKMVGVIDPKLYRNRR